MSDPVIPMDLTERVRRRAVLRIRELAAALEQAPRYTLPDVLIRLPLSEVESSTHFLRRWRHSRKHFVPVPEAEWSGE